MLQNARNVFLVLMQQITDSVLRQVTTNLRSASILMRYIKCHEALQEFPDNLCRTSINNGEEHLGEVLATPNNKDDMPYKIKTVAYLAQYFSQQG